MSRLLLLFIIALMPICTEVQAGMWSNIKGLFGYNEKCPAPTMRVLIAHDLPKVDVEVKGPYSLYDPYTNCYISTRFIGKSRTVQPMSDGLKWGEAFPGLYQLKISPEELTGVVAVDGKDYNGAVFIYDIGGTISLVNQVPVEEYIKSILSSDELQSHHPETLAALAIVARTNAYFQAVNPKNTYWAVDATKVGYTGYRNTSLPIDNAVGLTRHMILSQSSIYEGVATPFAAHFGPVEPASTGDVRESKISLEEANTMALRGDHAAQILGKAFPGTMIMLMNY